MQVDCGSNGDDNIAIGRQAGQAFGGSTNIAIGKLAGFKCGGR